MQTCLRIFVALLLAVSVGRETSFAQETATEPLSLSEAVERAVSNNRQLQIADYEYRSAQTDINKMKSVFLPQVDAAVTGSVTNLPLNAFGIKLNHGDIQQSDFNPSILNDPAAITNLQSQFMVRQPIMNLDGWSMKNATEARSEAYGLQTAWTRQNLEYQVVQSYLQLRLAHEAVSVLKKAEETALASLKLARDNQEAGYVQQVDILSMEVRIKEIEDQLVRAESNILNASDNLSFLMGEGYGRIFMPSDSMSLTDASSVLTDPLPTSRSDLRAMELQVEAQQSMLEAAKRSLAPRINAFGAYEINNPLDFAGSAHGYVVALQASWSIFNGNQNRSSVQKAKIDLDRLSASREQAMAQSELELQMARRALSDSRSKIELMEASIDQAREYLRIKTNRFEEGLEKVTDILMAESDLARKQMDYIQALYEHQLAYAKIKLLLEL